VSRGLDDLLAELGAKLLSTTKDEARFLEAARDVLATDPELKRRLNPRTRKQLLNGPIDSPAWKAALLAQVWRALPRGTKDLESAANIWRALPSKTAPKVAAVAGLRILTAYLITRGLNEAVSRDTLLSAALFLRESQREIERLQPSITGGIRTERPVGPDPAVEWARQALAEWRAKNPEKLKSPGIRLLYNNQARKHYPKRWRDWKSFRSWINRNKIAV
jgi:hypothetical protein